MKRDSFGIVLCALMLILVMAVGTAFFGMAFGGVRLVPAAENAGTERYSAMPADSAYWISIDLDPSQLYSEACRYTVFLSWEEKTTDENEMAKSLSATGVVISNDGYILTNAHCVSAALAAGDAMQVEFRDGKKYEGVIVGSDDETEVALIKIDAAYVPAAEIGSSKSLKPCQTVYVMGNPDEDLKYTMTCGIISGLDRSITFRNDVTLNMFQIDAPVNPGNSGGPVLDTHGRLIGIVTAKYLDFTMEGLGFALPIDDVMAVAADLKTYGYVKGRPLMGIIVQNTTENLICPGSPAGPMVYSVEEGLAGAKAGLEKGDIIVSINDKTIASLDDLAEMKKNYHAFDSVILRVWRKGDILTMKLTFDEVTPEHPTGSVVIPKEEESPAGEGETPETPAEDSGGENPASPDEG